MMETGCILCQDQRQRAQTKHKRFHMIIRTHLFTVRVTEHWHRLPRDVVMSLFLVILKITWTLSWATGPREPLFQQRGWTRQLPKVPSILSPSVVCSVKEIYLKQTSVV